MTVWNLESRYSADRQSERRLVHPLRVGFWSLLVGVVLICVPFKRVVVWGNSMHPTLKDGESYLVDRGYWRLTGLQRDDIVVFRLANDELCRIRRARRPGVRSG
jgi:hypothetical protein